MTGMPAAGHGVRASLPKILGREEELAALRSALVPGDAALILGAKGIGKSALLSALHRVASAEGFAAGLARATDRKGETLAHLLTSLGAAAPVTRLGVRALEARLLRWCDTHRCAVLVDDADRASAGLLHTLRRVALETSACMVVAARTGPADAPDRLRRAVLAGKEVQLGPLPPSAARALARAAAVPTNLVEEIVRRSAGIPVAIVEMARHHGDARYQVGGQAAWELLLADLRISNRL